MSIAITANVTTTQASSATSSGRLTLTERARHDGPAKATPKYVVEGLGF